MFAFHLPKVLFAILDIFLTFCTLFDFISWWTFSLVFKNQRKTEQKVAAAKFSRPQKKSCCMKSLSWHIFWQIIHKVLALQRAATAKNCQDKSQPTCCQKISRGPESHVAQFTNPTHKKSKQMDPLKYFLALDTALKKFVFYFLSKLTLWKNAKRGWKFHWKEF